MHLLQKTGIVLSAVILLAQPSSQTLCSVPKNPAPKGFHCEQQGSLSKPVRPISTASGVSDSVTCRNTCLQTRGCVSFGYRSKNGLCSLYPTTLNSQGFKAATTSGVTYGNMHCYTATTVDTTSDSNNCGSCGNACTTGTTCYQGVCPLVFSLQMSGSGIIDSNDMSIDGSIAVTNPNTFLYVGNDPSAEPLHSYFVDPSTGHLRTLQPGSATSIPVVANQDNPDSFGVLDLLAFDGGYPPVVCEAPSMGSPLDCVVTSDAGNLFPGFAVDTGAGGYNGYYIWAANGNKNSVDFPTVTLTPVVPR